MYICVNHRTCRYTCARKYPFIAKHVYNQVILCGENIHFHCTYIGKDTFHIKYQKPQQGEEKK